MPVRAAQFFRSLHEWMFEHFFCTEEANHFHILDGFALGLYNSAKEACKRFQEDHIQDLGPFVEAKLDFRHSDLLRAAHLTMRKNQFIFAYVTNSKDTPIYEFAFALHHWRRQISLHFAFLQWIKREGHEALKAAADGTSPTASTASCVAGENLDGEDYFKFKLLSEMPPTFSTHDVRMKFRNPTRTKDRRIDCCPPKGYQSIFILFLLPSSNVNNSKTES